MIRKIKRRIGRLNAMHYCLACDCWLGFRGFCSKKCHDKHYDTMMFNDMLKRDLRVAN